MCVIFLKKFYSPSSGLGSYLSAPEKKEKELIQTILLNEVCNQCSTFFYAFYKRKKLHFNESLS